MRTRPALPLGALALGAALLSWAAPARPDGAADGCDALRQSYAAALAAAQVCRPEAAAQCQATRPAALDDACHCQAAVEAARAAELDAIAARYRARSCPAAAGPCNRRCLAPVGRCLPRPGAEARCG